MTTFNPFGDIEGIIPVDVTTPEPAPLCVGSTYTFNLGKRQLIADFVAERFDGDMRAAFNTLCARLTPAQLPNWDLTIGDRASEWANARVADNGLTERQVQAAAYFAGLLLNQGHNDASVNAEIARLPKAMREALATKLVLASTRGEYNNVRTTVMSMVPALKRTNRDDNPVQPGDEHVFAGVTPGNGEPF